MAGGVRGLGLKELLSLKKDRLLTCLNKLNDRDTQKRAAEELADLLQDKVWLDPEALPITVHSLCNTGSEQKVYARKEVARALARLASSTCPQRNSAIAPPFLSKVVGQLKKLMQDPDSSVRDAASEALATVAHGLAEIDAPEASLPTSQHPVGKAVLECLPDGKKDLQASACNALGMAAQYCGQVDPVLVKEVLKRISTPSFQAAHALLAAVGRVDQATNAPQGLLMASPGAFQAHLNTMVGQPPSGPGATNPTSGSGLCGCLASKDWQTRKAAADCVRCAALVLGPLIEGDGGWTPSDSKSLTHRLIRALEGPKFDKVKEVRETAREAYAVIDTLMAYGRGGGGTAGWTDHATGAGLSGSISAIQDDSPLPAPTLRRSRSPPGARAALPPSRARVPSPPRQSAFQRNSSLAERFRKAAEERDSVVDISSRANSRPQTAVESADSGVLDAGILTSTAGSSGPTSRPVSADGGYGTGSGTGAVIPPVTRSLSRQGSSRPMSAKTVTSINDDLGPDHALDVTLMDRNPSSAALNATPSMLLPPSNRNNSGKSSRPLSASGLPSSAAPPRSSSAASRPLGTDHASLQTVTVSLTEWQAVQRQIRDMEGRHREIVDAMAVQSATSTRTISELQDRIRLLESQLQQQGGSPSPTPSNPIPGILASPLVLPPPALNPPSVPSSPPRISTPTGFPSAKYAIPNPPASPARRITTDPWASSGVLSPGSQHHHSGNGGGLPLLLPSAEPSLTTSPSFSSARQLYASASPAESPKVSLSNINIMQPVSPTRSTANQQGPLLDVNAAYQEALAVGPASAEMQRLLSRTGAAWGALSPDVAHALLKAFMGLLQDPFTLPRVIPWLWRLADEHQAPGLQEAGITYREQEDLLISLQAAVNAWQQANHPEMASKLQLLHQTLQSHWSNTNTGSGALSPTSVQSFRSLATGRASQAGLPAQTRPWSGHSASGDLSRIVGCAAGVSRMGPGQAGTSKSPMPGMDLVPGAESGRLRSLTPAQVRAAAGSELQPSLSVASSAGSAPGVTADVSAGETRPGTALRGPLGSRGGGSGGSAGGSGTFTPIPPTSAPSGVGSRPSSAVPHAPSPPQQQQGLYEGMPSTDLPAHAPRPFSTITEVPTPPPSKMDDLDSTHSKEVLKATFSNAISSATTLAAEEAVGAVPITAVGQEPSLAVTHTIMSVPADPACSAVSLPDMPLDSATPAQPPAVTPERADSRRMSDSIPSATITPLGLPPPGPSADGVASSSRRTSADRLPRASSGAPSPHPSNLKGASSRERSPMPPVTRSPSTNTARAPVAGLQQLKSNFEALERDFMQSPAFLKARMLTEAAKERAASVSPPLSECGQGVVADEDGNVVAVLPPSHLSMRGSGTEEQQEEHLPGIETGSRSGEGTGQIPSGEGGGGGFQRQPSSVSPIEASETHEGGEGAEVPIQREEEQATTLHGGMAQAPSVPGMGTLAPETVIQSSVIQIQSHGLVV